MNYYNSLTLDKWQSFAKKNKLDVIFKYLLIFVVFLVSSFAGLNNGVIAPFAFGVYFGLLVLKVNPYLTSLLYVLAFSLSGMSLEYVYIALNVAVAGIIISFIYKKLNKPINKYILALVAIMGNAAFLYFNATDTSSVITSSVSVLLGIMFLFACLNFFKATFQKGFNLKLNVDEIISGSIILIVLSSGFSSINIYGFELVKMFVVVAVLFSAYLFPGFTSVFIGVVVGLGAALYTNNVMFISTFACFGLVAKAFKSNNKIYSCVAIILCEIVFGLYFKTYASFSVYSVVSVVVAEILFLIIPTRYINALGDFLGGVKEKVAIRNIINHSREGICRRMIEISNVFGEMNGVFRDMVKGVLPAEEAKKVLTSEIIEKTIKACPEIAKAYRQDSKSTIEVFSNIVTTGFERGRVTLLDIPQFITSRCTKTNYMINVINQLLDSYKHYATIVTNMDSSRMLIAEQLSGVSEILKNLSEEVKLNITFDLSKENRIIEDLSYKNVYCVEAIVYEKNAFVNNTTLVIKDTDYKKEVIEKVVSKVVQSKMKVVAVSESSVSGCLIVNLQTMPNHDIVFGSASCGKGGEMISGDTHSIIKIDDGKFMVALCDGMGSGNLANKTSNLTISLIENFYKAGFDNEIILNSVNKLLSLNSEENFSALDVCVIDTQKGLCDFVKLGSPEGFIKHRSTTETIETCGLPIGVLDEMKPNISKKVLSDFDVIVLVSDGVTDAFRKYEDLKTFINNINSVNPQTIADTVLERAVDLNDGICEDDMTVVAVRVYSVD